MTLSVSPAEFMASTPAPTGGNSPWASGYGYDLRDVIVRQAHRQPRSVQRHLGPSELGSPCPRQIVSKLCGPGVASYTNHVADPWPSVVGTAVHAQLAQFFENENQLNGTKRWYTETRVHPHPLYPGTSDVYDAVEKCVTDWKIQGPTSMAKIRSREGPAAVQGPGAAVRLGLAQRRVRGPPGGDRVDAAHRQVTVGHVRLGEGHHPRR